MDIHAVEIRMKDTRKGQRYEMWSTECKEYMKTINCGIHDIRCGM